MRLIYYITLLLAYQSASAQLDELNFNLQVEIYKNSVVVEVEKEILSLTHTNTSIPILSITRECIVTEVKKGNVAARKLKLVEDRHEDIERYVKVFDKYDRIVRNLKPENRKYIFFFNPEDVNKDGSISSEFRLHEYFEIYDIYLNKQALTSQSWTIPFSPPENSRTP